MQFRIGDRDPVTGLYGVIYPDGSSTPNGIKIFNAAHQSGDIVLATQRSDGMMILDSAKAFEPSTTTAEIGLRGFGDRPVGYLNGQIFNNEEESKPKDLPIIIKYARPISDSFSPLPLLFPTAMVCNLPQTTIEINNPFSAYPIEQIFNATQLENIPSSWDQIQTNAQHPLRLEMDNFVVTTPVEDIAYYGCLYFQIDIKLMRQVLAGLSCRYLLIASSGWYDDILSDLPSIVSVQKRLNLQPDQNGKIIANPTECSQPYLGNGGTTKGWIDPQWLCKSKLTPVINPNNNPILNYKHVFCCIQLDIQTGEITFLEPFYNPSPINIPDFEYTIVSQRPQIVNL